MFLTFFTSMLALDKVNEIDHLMLISFCEHSNKKVVNSSTTLHPTNLFMYTDIIISFQGS